MWRDRLKCATDRLPLSQMKAGDFRQPVHAYRFFWLGNAALALVVLLSRRGAPALLLALMLAGCATDGLKSSVAGSCAVFERPPYVVVGKTQYDQDVADKFIESGVAGCRWERPAPRPAELDRMGAPKVAQAPAAKRKGLLSRVRHKVAAAAARVTGRLPQAPPAPAAPAFPDGPVAPVATTPAPPEPPTPPAEPPPAPRSKIERLLHPEPFP